MPSRFIHVVTRFHGKISPFLMVIDIILMQRILSINFIRIIPFINSSNIINIIKFICCDTINDIKGIKYNF